MRTKLKWHLLIVPCIALLAPATADAQYVNNPTSTDIIKALKPKPQPPRARTLIGAQKPRGIGVEEGDTTEPPPSINLQVNFEFDSSNLTNDARLTLKALGDALQAKDLAGLRFRIVGHTDAVGTAEYNMDLSKRRAEAVRSHLVQFYSIESKRLEAEGKGKTELIDSANPEDGINRRVQIITLTQEARGR